MQQLNFDPDNYKGQYYVKKWYEPYMGYYKLFDMTVIYEKDVDEYTDICYGVGYQIAGYYDKSEVRLCTPDELYIIKYVIDNMLYKDENNAESIICKHIRSLKIDSILSRK